MEWVKGPLIRNGITRPLSPVYSVGLTAMLVTGGLLIVPAYSVAVPPNQPTPGSLLSTEVRPQYALGNVTLGPPGDEPSSMVFDPETGNVYVMVQPSWIKVISTRNDSVVATINLESRLLDGPEVMALDSANGDILIGTASGSTAVFSPANDTVVGELPVGSEPILYDSATNRVLVNNGQNITVLNGTTLAPIDSFSTGVTPALSDDPSAREVYFLSYSVFHNIVWYVTALWDTNYSVAWRVTPPELTNHEGISDMAYDSADGDIYIPTGYNASGACTGTNAACFVLVLNATTGATVGSVAVGDEPTAIAFDGESGTVFVANLYSDNVSVIRGTTLAVASIAVGGGPYGLVDATGTGNVFVANADSDSITVLQAETGSTVTTVTLGFAPDAVAYDPSTETIYAAGAQSVELVSDTAHRSFATIAVGALPQALAYDSETGNLYVANSDNNTVSIVSGISNQVLRTLSVGFYPDGLAYDNASGDVIVACYLSNAVYVISDVTDSVSSVVSLGTAMYPTGVVYDPATNDVYVSGFGTLSVISGSGWQVTATISAFTSNGVGDPALDTANGDLYVPVGGDAAVVSTATDSVVKNVSIWADCYPCAAAFDAATGDVFVANSLGDNVSVIDGADNVVIANLSVGEYPAGIGYDNRTGEIYVANEYSDTLTYIVAMTPPLSPLGAVFWAALISMVMLGAVGMFFAVWISRPTARPRTRVPGG
jgi:YVTN family beta-propeller protein